MSKARILVVEDNDDVRTMYGMLLRSWGYEIYEAPNGTEGLEKARFLRPDLIILDVMMPDIDGYEVCQRLREDPEFHTIPIIFVTALGGIDDRVKAYTTGADDFITKGQISRKELDVRIQAALARNQRIQQSAKSQATAGEPPRPPQGIVVGISSLRGGVGVSSIALNLAAMAAHNSERPVLLVDMAFPIGSLGLWSGFSGSRHVVELLNQHAFDMNRTLINHYSVQHVQGFFIIPGPTGLVNFHQIQAGTVLRFISLLRESGYYAILDLGRGTLPFIWGVPKACDWNVVVTDDDPTARHLAGLYLKALGEHGVDQRSLLLVYNDRQQRDVSTGIGLPRPPDVVIPYHPDISTLPEDNPVASLWDIVQRSLLQEEIAVQKHRL